MVRSERFKHCVFDSASESVRESLVDLVNDPGEMKNLATSAEFNDALRIHRQYLAEWITKSNDIQAKSFAIGAE